MTIFFEEKGFARTESFLVELREKIENIAIRIREWNAGQDVGVHSRHAVVLGLDRAMKALQIAVDELKRADRKYREDREGHASKI